MPRPTRLDYCQYLLNSQVNFTLTNFSQHCEDFSHDAIKRYLEGDRITPRLVWETVHNQIIQTGTGYVIFDDSVLDKSHSSSIELVRRQYSGNEHRIIRGIGVVNGVYVHPSLTQFWIIDYRIFDPDGDGKTKLEHVKDMFNNLV